ncbi:MAG: hypothetical protein ACI4ES_07725 [Roseburia sp.]
MKEKEEKKLDIVETENLKIQSTNVNLEKEEENPGIGYEIVIGLE